GSGVQPDVEIPEVRAFSRAYRDALGSLLEQERDQEKRRNLERALRRADGESEPVSLDAAELGALAGTYGRLRIVLDSDHLYYVRDERSRYRMIPITRDWFRFESAWAQFEFIRDDGGTVTELVRTFKDGSTDTHPRIAEEKTQQE
ncbi:MAG: hypothetical protein ACYS7M_10505, partial [Planctomycetota bacterium]